MSMRPGPHVHAAGADVRTPPRSSSSLHERESDADHNERPNVPRSTCPAATCSPLQNGSAGRPLETLVHCLPSSLANTRESVAAYSVDGLASQSTAISNTVLGGVVTVPRNV